VPHFWIKVQGNPISPQKMLEKTREAARSVGGVELVEDQIFFKRGNKTRGYVTFTADNSDGAAKFERELKDRQQLGPYDCEQVYTAAEIEQQPVDGGPTAG
jgi:hypothetical protein